MVTESVENQSIIDVIESINTINTLVISEIKTQKKELEEVKIVTYEQGQRLHEIEERPKANQRIKHAVNERVRELKKQGYDVHWATIYNVLHEHYGVSKYDAIPLDKTEEAITVVNNFTPKRKRRWLI